MKMPRHLGALVALGALTALPACSSSMFGGGSHASSQYSQRNYTPPASYNMGSGSQTAMNQEEVPTTPETVRKVQHALKQNGDYNSRVDGVWGPMTENGVRKWQQAHNLTVNGAIDVATLQSMNISADGQNQPNANDSTQPYGNNNGPANNTQGSNNAAGSSYATNPSNNMPAPDNAGTNNTNGTTNNPGPSH